MTTIPPFQTPLDRPPDPEAWVGGVRRRATWRRRGKYLDCAGFHKLLRAAQLPRPELEHMAGGLALLERADWVPEKAATWMLGRIAWDARWGAQGESWTRSEWDYLTLALGAAVVAEFFHD